MRPIWLSLSLIRVDRAFFRRSLTTCYVYQLKSCLCASNYTTSFYIHYMQKRYEKERLNYCLCPTCIFSSTWRMRFSDVALTDCFACRFLGEHQWIHRYSAANERDQLPGQDAGKFWHDRCPAGGPGHQRWCGQGVLPPGPEPLHATASGRPREPGFPRRRRGDAHALGHHHLGEHGRTRTRGTRRRPTEQGEAVPSILTAKMKHLVKWKIILGLAPCEIYQKTCLKRCRKTWPEVSITLLWSSTV